MRRRTGSKVLSSSQLSLGTQYHSSRDRSLTFSGSVVLSGSPVHSVPEAASGTPSPRQGGVPLTAPLCGWFGGSLREISEPKIADVDVLLLPAVQWGRLPVCATLYCLQAFEALAVSLTSSERVWRAHRRRGRIVFGLQEWASLVSSFSNDRASAASFAEWCVCKQKQPTWKLTLRDALGCTLGDLRPALASATMGDVLRAWGLALQCVSYDDEVST
jgi:hypothetical protein